MGMNTLLLDYVKGANPPYELQKIDTIFIDFFGKLKALLNCLLQILHLVK